jgi:folate-binding protein YgfZ
MSTNWNLISLGDLGVLRFRGADAVRFLQGQVSNDVERLSGERSQLAGYHNPQGRVMALLRLVQLAPDDVVAVLPRELIETVAARLGKFVLRAKVKIADDSTEWRVQGLVAPRGADSRAASATRVEESAGTGEAGKRRAAKSASSGKASAADVEERAGSGEFGAGVGEAGAGAAGVTDEESADTAAAFEARASSWAAAQFEQARAAATTAGELSSAAAQLEEAESVVPLPTASAVMLPDSVHGQSRSGGAVIVRVGAVPARWLVLSPAGESAPLAGCDAAARDVWRLLDIADGEAQVYAATSEEFVAQMLNLDALDAIAFDKGCYTGQEVIARAHYRGRVKRRLQRFVSRGAAALAVGESGTLADGRAFKVVEAVSLTDGRCEFLAVAPFVGGTTGAMEAAGAASADAPGGIGEAATDSPGGKPDSGAAGVSASAGVGASGRAAGAASAGVRANAGEDTTRQTTRSAPMIDAEVLTLPYPLPE